MTSRVVMLLLLLTVAAACETRPTAPTVIPAPSVPAVATARPLIWDSAEELAAWVTSGVSTRNIAIVGSDVDAVIQVDFREVNASLHGPDLDPAINEIQTVRMRYRWVDRGASDSSLSITIYLREPGTGVPVTIPALRPPTGQSTTDTEFRSGAWVERTLVSQSSSVRPPYRVRFALVQIGNLIAGPRNYHGHIEIDWIALTPDPVR